tara:strand:- start:961 stop:1227 length:267 start_codon:yes stop_codon:yes gene_type:complete
MKMKPKTKVTKEELKNLQNVLDTLNQIQLQLGILETRKHHLVTHAISQQGLLRKTQEDLETKYGKVDININDGSIKEKDIIDELNKKN